MARLLAFLGAFMAAGLLWGDDVVLKDGRTVEWRVLKDVGDALEVQTVDNKTLTIPKKDVKEIRTSAQKTPLTGATFTGDQTKGSAPVNLLPQIDPKKHVSGGECRLAGGAIVCAGGGILDIPYIPAGSYDLEITIERRDGEDECHIGLVAFGKPFSVQIDWSKGQCTGLSEIDGKPIYGNETRVNGRMLQLRKPKTFVCAVRPEQIVILSEGKEIINWKGDPKRLSLGARPEKFQNLFIGFTGGLAISKYVLTPRKE